MSYENEWQDAGEFGEELPFGGSEEKKDSNVVGKCPVCGKDVVDRKKAFFCSNMDCKFALWKNNRFFEAISKEMDRPTAEELLLKGTVKLEDCVSKRTGNKFSCYVDMETDPDSRPQFSIRFGNK